METEVGELHISVSRLGWWQQPSGPSFLVYGLWLEQHVLELHFLEGHKGNGSLEVFWECSRKQALNLLLPPFRGSHHHLTFVLDLLLKLEVISFPHLIPESH